MSSPSPSQKRRARKWRREHREETAAYNLAYRRDHRAAISARLKRYYKRLRGRLRKVGAEILSAARLDPRYEERHGILDRVICRICGVMRKNLGPTHFRYFHGLTTQAYDDLHPDAPTWSIASRRRASRAQKRVKSVLRHRARRNMKSVYAHPGDKPMRTWSCVALRSMGMTVAETSIDLERSQAIVRLRASQVGIDSTPCRYDLGVPVTYGHVSRLYEASGLDRRAFARAFEIPLDVAYRISPSSKRSERLTPSRALSIVAARDRLIRELASQKRSWKWGRTNLRGVLTALLPDLRQTYRKVTNVFIPTAKFLGAEREAGIERWQDWLCDQARFEVAGRLSGHAFSEFLPFAPEISGFVEENLEAFRTGDRPSHLAVSALAWRFGTSPVIIGFCGRSEKSEPLPAAPHDMQRYILGALHDRASASATPGPKRKRGRPRRDGLTDAAVRLWAHGCENHEIATKIAEEMPALFSNEEQREAWLKDGRNGAPAIMQLLYRWRKAHPDEAKELRAQRTAAKKIRVADRGSV